MIKKIKFLKKTKIIATLGPSTDNINILKDMVYSGVDMLRINFSHANYDHVKERIKMIKYINHKYKFNISIIGDLQGPKLRIGKVKKNTVIRKNNELIFTNKPLISDGSSVFLNYDKFANDVKINDKILLDDGKIILKCKKINLNDKIVITKIIQGGELKSNKGVNLPNTKIKIPSLTEKDIQDVLFSINENIDIIALSFVRNKEDLNKLKKLIYKNNNYQNIPIIAKIEKPEAIDNIKEIIKNCDAIMVARGDLGIEIPLEELPMIQKKLVNKAKKYKTPVIIATQMMENMIDNIIPTRAEINDIANSVLDGADALMLSAETSIGSYPVKVIKQMSKIIQNIEKNICKKKINTNINNDNSKINNIICYQAIQLAENINSKIIITQANTIGNNIIELSSYKSSNFIIAFNNNSNINNILNLFRGVILINNTDLPETDLIKKTLKKHQNIKYLIKQEAYMIFLKPVEEEKKINNIITLIKC